MKSCVEFLSIALLLSSLLASHDAAAQTWLERLKAAVTDGSGPYVTGAAPPAETLRADAGELDGAGRACMLCHGARSQLPLGLMTQLTLLGPANFSPVGHPLGMSYDRVARSDPRSYRRSDELGNEISLVDGRLSCVTCHRLEGHEPREIATMDAGAVVAGQCLASKRLAQGRGGTGLCLGCHIN